ncbi:hypothetical protein P261_01970 [Lachnospiraceae bacterium TWA4]|nr:hypothetical protein P261_01970 [Lachnospiraceae bacterium TWA4]
MIVALSIFVFVSPLKHEYCYPIIFLGATILDFVSAIAKYGNSYKSHGHTLPVFIQVFFGVVLLVITFLSIVSIWRA